MKVDRRDTWTQASVVTAMLLCCSLASAVDRIDSSASETAERQTSKATKSQNENNTRTVQRKPELVAMEVVAMQLVDEHLQELKGMLDQLRTRNPNHYRIAIRDLSRAAKRLENAKKRGEQLFEIEIELLKAQTHATLLTAKLKVNDNNPLRKELREATDRLVHAQINRAEFDVQIMTQRIEKAMQQLETAERLLETKKTNHEEDIEKTYRSFLNRVGLSADNPSDASP
ncbi:hypothetical protein CA13_43740 [Planctomycetes bacterium CA13]|uniref:Chromosome partition protein Smc n=1 Tax=Novipirellula herctigrandis TaxID=2527986 RepID=A0A5C5Z7V2_9BACT|nr:hypothetical protein CA13_43740 [Planctomycetes bacterium CA13]